MKTKYQKPTTKRTITELEALLVEGSIIGGGSGGPGVAEGKGFFNNEEDDIDAAPKSIWDN